MPTGNPYDQYLRVLKEARKPTQAPSVKGAPSTAADFVQSRKALSKPSQTPTPKGPIVLGTAADLARVRNAHTAPTQAPSAVK
jgi:hypothetical protein